MISINAQLFNKSMTELIEYMEKLEVLGPLINSQVPRKMKRTSQKIRLESLKKKRLRNFTRKILSSKAEREREITLTLMMTSMISTV